MEIKKLTGFQLRTARAATRLSIDELSKLACISRATLLRIEKTPDFEYPKCNQSSLKLLQDFFESYGIEFLGTQAIYLMNEIEKEKFRINKKSIL